MKIPNIKERYEEIRRLEPEIAKKIRDEGKAKAREAGKTYQGSGAPRRRTNNELGKQVGLSGESVRKIKKIYEAAEKDPRYQPVVEEMEKTGKIEPAYRRLREMQTKVPRKTP